MATLHVENHVRDFDTWKVVFDKFADQRRRRGVVSYRVARGHDDPNQVIIDLDFASVPQAEEFRDFLNAVLATPQAASELADHRPPAVFEVVEERMRTAGVAGV